MVKCGVGDLIEPCPCAKWSKTCRERFRYSDGDAVCATIIADFINEKEESLGKTFLTRTL